MTNEKKSFLKKIITKVKKVYSYLNKDINKLKKAQSEDVQGGEPKHTNSAQESNDTQKNVFDIIDESQNENIEPEEKARIYLFKQYRQFYNMHLEVNLITHC